MGFFYIIINQTVLHCACAEGDIVSVKYLISLNKLNVKDVTILAILLFS